MSAWPKIKKLVEGKRAIEAQIKIIKSGVAYHYYELISDALAVPQKALLTAINIPQRTLIERKNQGKFKQDESERVLRLFNLFYQAVKILGSEQRARNWFISELPALGGKSPLEYVETDIGTQEVRDVLGRIQYSVYS